MELKLLSMDQAAEMLGISPSTLYKMCMRKKIGYKKVGRLNKFTEKDLEKYIKAHSIEARPIGY